jgi:hypothetical protein
MTDEINEKKEVCKQSSFVIEIKIETKGQNQRTRAKNSPNNINNNNKMHQTDFRF